MAEKRPDRPRGPRKPEAKAVVAAQGQFQTLRMTRKNWTLFGAGIASIAVGFALLAAGDITVAPILLLLGYLVLIPWSLVAVAGQPKPRGDRDEQKLRGDRDERTQPEAPGAGRGGPAGGSARRPIG